MKKFLVLALLMLSFNASAITDVSGKVARIYVNGNWVFFSLKNDQCGQGIGVYYQFQLTSEGAKAWYSLLLAAANTDKPVGVSIDACPTPAASSLIRYLYQDF